MPPHRKDEMVNWPLMTSEPFTYSRMNEQNPINGTRPHSVYFMYATRLVLRRF